MFTVFIMFNKAQLSNKMQASIDFDKCANLYRDEACITQESKLCHFCFLFSSLSNVRVSSARARNPFHPVCGIDRWLCMVVYNLMLGAIREANVTTGVAQTDLDTFFYIKCERVKTSLAFLRYMIFCKAMFHLVLHITTLQM